MFFLFSFFFYYYCVLLFNFYFHFWNEKLFRIYNALYNFWYNNKLTNSLWFYDFATHFNHWKVKYNIQVILIYIGDMYLFCDDYLALYLTLHYVNIIYNIYISFKRNFRKYNHVDYSD